MQKVLTCAQMRAADKYTIQELGVASQVLMERAGAAIAEETEKLLQETGGTSVLAVCGGGNNGGDGWCAARLLLEKGYRAAVFTLTDILSPDCAAQREKFAGEVFSSFPEEKFDVVIDAVFGTGFHGAPEGRFADAVKRINGCGAKVVSADIPSGLNGDDGSFVSCVNADVTVAVGELKVGHLIGNGPDVCGKTVRKDIGIEVTAPPFAELCEGADFVKFFPPRKKNTHKGTFGRAAILAGSRLYTGAPLLSAAAALRCGCGYTQLCVPEEMYPYYIGKLPEAILTAAPSENGALRADGEFLRSLAANAGSVAVGMGCGVSRALYDCVAMLLSEYSGTLVLDADALGALAAYGVDILKEKSCRVVLTPHLKEFSRLCGKSVEEVAKNGPALAKQFAAEYGAVVLLKSHTCFVTNGRVGRFITEGTPALAKGGSGDVLSGIAAALAARGISAADSAACAAFLLGRAGRFAAEYPSNEYSATATDVIACLPRAVTSLMRGE